MFKAQFQESSLADGFADALLSLDVTSVDRILVEGQQVTLVVARWDGGCPLIIGRVVSDRSRTAELDQRNELITQGYATTLRNWVSDGNRPDSPLALLIVAHAAQELDTLEAGEDLLSPGGPLDVGTIAADLLSPHEWDPPGVRGFLRALRSQVFDGADLSPEDLGAICRIRGGLSDENLSSVNEEIGSLRGFLPEDRIDQSLFHKNADVIEAQKKFEEIIRDNVANYGRLASAHRVGRDHEAAILDAYEQDVLTALAAHDDWRHVPAGQVSRHKKRQRTAQRYSGPSVEHAKHVANNAAKRPDGFVEQSLFVLPTGPEPAIRFEFKEDLDDTPYEPASVTKRLNTLRLSLEPEIAGGARFHQVNVHSGKKSVRGNPSHRFNVAVLPKWAFEALPLDGARIDADEDVQAIVFENEQSIIIGDTEGHVKTEMLAEDGHTFEVDGNLEICLDDSWDGEISCFVGPPGQIPLKLTFRTADSRAQTKRIPMPIVLAAIADPGTWTDGSGNISQNVRIDISRGTFDLPTGEKYAFNEEAIPFLNLEELIVYEGSPAQRHAAGPEMSDAHIHDSDRQRVSQSIQDAYNGLFEVFRERSTTPSTDVWDDRTIYCARQVVDAYVAAAESCAGQLFSGEAQALADLAVVRSSASQKVWVTPFHPVMLAYLIRLCEWRDTELEGRRGGFRRPGMLQKLNPLGLLPYLVDRTDQRILAGQMLPNMNTWLEYARESGVGSVTPRFVERIVREKLKAFCEAFPPLVELHPGRRIVLNVINLGDLAPMVSGLFGFYKDAQKQHRIPNVLVRIYGNESEGQELDSFFAHHTRSKLQIKLENMNDEIVDLMRMHVSYVKAGPWTGQPKSAHLTFFRGLISEKNGVIDQPKQDHEYHLDGLFPRSKVSVKDKAQGGVHVLSFVEPGNGDHYLTRCSSIANALEAAASTRSVDLGKTPSKQISSIDLAGLERIWQESLWVVHVQPNVGLDFYTVPHSDGKEDMILIHYSDQYDASTPDYDVVTSSIHGRHYRSALRTAVEQVALDFIDEDIVLRNLLAVDGELAIDVMTREPRKRTEILGNLGGLALSRELLRAGRPDCIWIPITLQELVRQTRRMGSKGAGILQFDAQGYASDDLCFVGVPAASEMTPTILLWIVENKGGSSSFEKGAEQVRGAREQFRKTLCPSERFADLALVKAEFGRVIFETATRFKHYRTISEADFTAVSRLQGQLVHGLYNVDFLEDVNGNSGDVVRVQRDRGVCECLVHDGVRVFQVPMSAVSIIGGATLDETLKDFPVQSWTQFRTSATKPGGQDGNSLTDTADLEVQMRVPGQLMRGQNDKTSVNVHEELPLQATSPGFGPEDRQAHASQGRQDLTASDDELKSGPDQRRASDIAHESRTEEDRQTREGRGGQEPTKTAEDDFSARDLAEPEEWKNAVASHYMSLRGLNPDDSAQDDRVTDAVDEAVVKRESQTHKWANLLSPSPPTHVDLNPSLYLSKLRQAFETVGLRVHPPSVSTLSVGPRKISVDIIPKDGQSVDRILRSLTDVSVYIRSTGPIQGYVVPEAGAVRLLIPHGQPAPVHLREALDTLAEQGLAQGLRVPLGVDAQGRHHVLNLLDERHALIAGATGSGKSNFLSGTIASLACRYSPSEVIMSLLDPKGVDFGRFAGLPHVGSGRYRETPDACVAYIQEIIESDLPRRKKLIQAASCTSVQDYNEMVRGADDLKIPYHVIIIDEYADLTMALGKRREEFEIALCRLAQIGRSMGYIILLATQRPSADIVSGRIKANFPCRISFKLPAAVDSKVVLDEVGAETLHGAGDMIARTHSERLLLQGYFLTAEDAWSVIRSF